MSGIANSKMSHVTESPGLSAGGRGEQMSLAKKREAVHRLWDELADFPAAQTDAAVVHFMTTLARLVRAGNGYWLGGVRLSTDYGNDPLHGWRPVSARHLYPAPVHSQAYSTLASRWNNRQIDPAFVITRKHEGTFRTIVKRRDLPASWFRSPYYLSYYAPRGFYDTCMICFPVNDDTESWFVFHRIELRRRFTAADEDLLAYALRPIKFFHRQLALSYGMLVAESPLTQSQRRVAQLLLTEKTEKEIALELGQNRHTVHWHITEIFHKFGVQSRAGLTAIWLGKTK